VNRSRPRMSVLSFLFISVVLAGCPWVGRSPERVVEDSAIMTEIKSRIFNDPQLSGFGIDVKSNRGEVTMTGTVRSEKERERAAAIANSISGVKNVENLLEVR
jgi:hyperosmotically inducible periplasmic protein